MHLSRRRNVLFFAEKTLRPGDGERSKDRDDAAFVYIDANDLASVK
jgi:hypothetical protein